MEHSDTPHNVHLGAPHTDQVILAQKVVCGGFVHTSRPHTRTSNRVFKKPNISFQWKKKRKQKT